MNQTKEIKSFFYSQYFSDGIRITIGAILPSLLLAQFGQLPVGIIVSLGALCASIPDTPGPIVHKRNAMLVTSLFCFFTALITGWFNTSPVLLSILIFALSFFFSMFLVFGNRASAVGIAALLVMVLTTSEQWGKITLWEYAFCILGGGLWYTALSVSINQIMPYRLAQQALGECMKEVAVYLRLKASFYQPDQDHEKLFRKLIDQQVAVNQQQDSVREVLFKSRVVMKESTPTGRLLILLFVDLVDLFEQTMATYYDYKTISTTFGKTGVLNAFQSMILKLADELMNISHHTIINKAPRKIYDLQQELEDLKKVIDRVENETGMNILVLKKILINCRNIVNRIEKMYSYFNHKGMENERRAGDLELRKFVEKTSFDFKLFFENLNFKSTIFRYALRFAIVCLTGYGIAHFLLSGRYSYWILLTILVILKPGFSMTKQRNWERLVGTLVGGIAGAAIVYYIKDETLLFVLLLVFMVIAYSFQRLNYIMSVAFMTPYILILFSLLGAGGVNIAEERIVDTLIGCAIAFAASYLIFPSWEHYHLQNYMKRALLANYKYLCMAAQGFAGKQLDITSYKLARKEVYVSSANLGSAFQRMLSEPRNKQRNPSDLHKFVVLNHSLSSYIATLIAALPSLDNKPGSAEQIKLLRKSLFHLGEVIRTMDHGTQFKDTEINLPEGLNGADVINEDARLLTEQLEIVQKLASDIQKVSERLV
ncbi:MAG TPA: FUSC family membrane protein [Sphingobacteriaceae bacterium]